MALTPEEQFAASITANRELKEEVQARVGQYDEKVNALDVLARQRLDQQQATLDQREQSLQQQFDAELNSLQLNGLLKTIYVDVNAAAGGDGSSAKPFNSMDTAIDAVPHGGHAEIRVAAGAYSIASYHSRFFASLYIQPNGLSSGDGREKITIKLLPFASTITLADGTKEKRVYTGGFSGTGDIWIRDIHIETADFSELESQGAIWRHVTGLLSSHWQALHRMFFYACKITHKDGSLAGNINLSLHVAMNSCIVEKAKTATVGSAGNLKESLINAGVGRFVFTGSISGYTTDGTDKPQHLLPSNYNPNNIVTNFPKV